jgi:hypothetical protein
VTLQYNKYKVELITQKVPDGGFCTAYRCGPFIDLCKGPHIPNSSLIKAWKVHKVFISNRISSFFLHEQWKWKIQTKSLLFFWLNDITFLLICLEFEFLLEERCKERSAATSLWYFVSKERTTSWMGTNDRRSKETWSS